MFQSSTPSSGENYRGYTWSPILGFFLLSEDRAQDTFSCPHLLAEMILPCSTRRWLYDLSFQMKTVPSRSFAQFSSWTTGVLWTTNSARVRSRSHALSVLQLYVAPLQIATWNCLGINKAKSHRSNDGHLLLHISSPMCNHRFIPFCRSNIRSRWAFATSMFDKALYNSSLPDGVRLLCRYIISLDTKIVSQHFLSSLT